MITHKQSATADTQLQLLSMTTVDTVV